MGGLASDLVHTIPTYFRLVLFARSITAFTPASVVTRPMFAIAKTSSQLTMYLSVIIFRAELVSRRPYVVSDLNGGIIGHNLPGRSMRIKPLLKILARRNTLYKISESQLAPRWESYFTLSM